MSLVRREGDREVARHLHGAVEQLASAYQAADAGALNTVERSAIWEAKEATEEAIAELGGDEFELLGLAGTVEFAERRRLKEATS